MAEAKKKAVQKAVVQKSAPKAGAKTTPKTITPTPAPPANSAYVRSRGLPAIMQYGYRVMTPKVDRGGRDSRVKVIIAAFLDETEAKTYLKMKKAAGFPKAEIVPGSGVGQ